MAFVHLSFQADAGGHTHGRIVDVGISTLVMAGWAGRDAAALQAHIDELAELGVTPPTKVPCFYPVAANQITSKTELQVVGPHTSGEVEFVLVPLADGLWIGTGSDETDRKLEAHSVAASKQICMKSIAPMLWRYDDVAAHWDQLRLRSWITTDAGRRLYQDRPVSDLLSPESLIERFCGTGVKTLPAETVLFSGTFQVIGSVGGGTRFEYELEDPVLRRRIQHGYNLRILPVTG